MTLDANDTEDFDFGDDDASAFYKNLTGAAEASTEGAEGSDDTAATTPATEAAEGSSEAPEGSQADAPAAGEEDDGEIDLKIGAESRKVKLSEIRKLLTQEKELTERTTNAGAEAARVTAVTTKATEVLNKALERAKERLAPYQELNLLVLSKTLDDATLIQVQKDMKAAEDEVRFYESQLGEVSHGYQQMVHAVQTQAAQTALKALTNPGDPRHIPNFDQKTYTDMVDFAVKTGMDRQSVLNITDAGAIKLLHMAMQFANGAKAADVKIKPVVNKPTKVLKPAASSGPVGKEDSKSSALAKLRRSGSEDDAVDAFYASLTNA